MLKKEIVKGQNSWCIQNNNIKLYLTEFAGQMAPVTFFKDTDHPVEPYYINPWAEENIDLAGQAGALKALRGDFLCLPFGGDNNWNNETHPPHGDVNEGKWIYQNDVNQEGILEASFSFQMKTRPGNVEKKIRLVEGHNVVYCSDTINGFSGPATLGHHATFHGESTKIISMGPFLCGFTAWSSSDGYGIDEYSSLESFKEFDTLNKVPTKWKNEPYTDCSVFPARKGFIDLLQVFVKEDEDFAWTCVAVPEEGYLWFALKDPKVLPSTVLWMENHGRHGIPWNGRNCCIGIEDVCSCFADGLSKSAEENELTDRGLTTSLCLDDKNPLEVRYIQGTARIPEGFNRVGSVKKIPQGILFISETGQSVSVEVDTDFLNL